MYKEILEKIAKSEQLAKNDFVKNNNSFDYKHGDEHPLNATTPDNSQHKVAHTAANGKTYWNQKVFRHKGVVGDQDAMDKVHHSKIQEFSINNPELSNNKHFMNSLKNLNSSVMSDPDRGLRVSGTSNNPSKGHQEMRQRHLLHALGGTGGYSIENVLHADTGEHLGVRVKARRHPPSGEHSETSWYYGSDGSGGIETEYNKPMGELKNMGIAAKGPAKKRKISNINDLLRMAASEQTFSEQEAIDMIKCLLMKKFEEYDHFTPEELEKNWKNAFKTGLTGLGLVNGAHYIGQDKPIDYKSQKAPKERVINNVEAKKPVLEDKIGRSPSSDSNENKTNNFLKAISMNESSGGINTDHQQMKRGIHAGDSAIGQYGLMPNTIKEMSTRMGRSHPLNSYSKMDSKGISESIRKNPDHEHQIAKFMANHLHNKFGGDESKMAYSWNQGHNLTQNHFDTSHKNYKDHDYVQKFNKNKSSFEKKPPEQTKPDKFASN
jgi:hypothetical protein